ncbi:MAG: cytochrome c oxidase subunit II [Gammaproteobacteria bacterium RIFCSPHIGHO2_12_FULL_38_14]|nr:MAG: cytochrome c oxidase subunit II [Gammaproteobacteria bacterium RIFCSPHIGHO2_12_FULL_38_14]
MRSVQSTLVALFTASSAAYAETTLNLTQGVSPISHDVYQLHMIIFLICVVIGLIVFGAMFYSIIFHRHSKGVKPAEFHSHTILEIGWTIVPAIILVLMAIPATKVLLNMNNNEKEEITIKITGYQWKWRYEYLEDGVSFFSNLSTPRDQMDNKAPKSPNYLREVDNPLVVPIHKKIRFLITSNDVNHSWWVPDLAVKRDAIAGFINEGWTKIDKAGTYRGQCAELCGINHAFMPIVVVATTEQGYKDWVAQQKGEAQQGSADVNKAWTMDELMKKGEQIYSRICAACHQPGGTGLPPTFPALKGSKVATGPIPNHVNTVFNGVSGTAMQAFKSQLSDVELASVITYERNAFGNNTGTMVQPIQIKAFRDGKSIEDALKVQPTGEAAAEPATKQPAVADDMKQEPAQASPAEEPQAQKAQTPAATTQTTAQETTTPAQTPPVAAQTVPTTEKPQTGIGQATTTTATTTDAKPEQKTAGTAPSTEEKPASVDDLKAAIARGEKVYLSTCAVCHQPAGTGLPPTFPALKGDPVTTGPLPMHINRVLNGKPGTAMQAFKDQLNDQQLADVITYERNAWGNNLGTLVTPDQIKSARALPPATN